MKTLLISFSTLLLLASFSFKTVSPVKTLNAVVAYDLPKGWFPAGSHPKKYEMGVDKGVAQQGKNAATIKSKDNAGEGFGTLMQSCLPGKYLGKRIRMSGYLKTKDVSDWAGFWLRVDTKEGEKNMPFDNMHDGKTNRSVKGTTSWTRFDIVLDIPASSELLSYGALLSGTGQIWFAEMSFEIVDASVPTTGKETVTSGLPEPSNLDFDK